MREIPLQMIPQQMIDGANSYLSMSRPTTLLDLMPDPTTTTGIFEYLADLPFIEPESNNLEYLYNRSGDKIPAPLVTRLADGDTLTPVSLQTLARIIRTRFKYKWESIWTEYSESSPVFNNIHLTTTETRDGRTSDTTDASTSRTTSANDSKTLNTTDKTILTGSHSDSSSGSDNATTTRTGSMLESEGGSTAESKSSSGTTTKKTQHEGTVGDTTTSSGDTSVWGFNSTSAVKATAETGTDGTTRTYNNTDTTTETPSLQDSSTTTHGKTTTTDYKDVKDGMVSTSTGTTTRKYDDETSTTTHSGTDTTLKSGTDSTESNATKSGTSYLSMTSTTTGYNIHNLSSKTEILKIMYEDPLFRNFWEVIYSDIDEVLTCPIFA